MPALTRAGDEQERRWREYLERLRGLEGAEYDRAEEEAWEELQRALRDAGDEPRQNQGTLG